MMNKVDELESVLNYDLHIPTLVALLYVRLDCDFPSEFFPDRDGFLASLLANYFNRPYSIVTVLTLKNYFSSTLTKPLYDHLSRVGHLNVQAIIHETLHRTHSIKHLNLKVIQIRPITSFCLVSNCQRRLDLHQTVIGIAYTPASYQEC